MRRVPIVLALILALAPACAPPPTIVTPQGQVAYTADQIVIRVNELEKTVIAAEASHAITTATTRTIVTFCASADRTLAATPAGWGKTVYTAWQQAKQAMPAADLTNPAIVAAMGAVDVVLAAYAGGAQ